MEKGGREKEEGRRGKQSEREGGEGRQWSATNMDRVYICRLQNIRMCSNVVSAHINNTVTVLC